MTFSRDCATQPWFNPENTGVSSRISSFDQCENRPRDDRMAHNAIRVGCEPAVWEDFAHASLTKQADSSENAGTAFVNGHGMNIALIWNDTISSGCPNRGSLPTAT